MPAGHLPDADQGAAAIYKLMVVLTVVIIAMRRGGPDLQRATRIPMAGLHLHGVSAGGAAAIIERNRQNG
jgi:hypothetical protein